MPNKKIKTSHKKRNRYIFIGNYKNNNNNNNNEDNDDDDGISSLQCEINLLSSRLKLIEDALSSSVIIKAKPIMSIIMGDTNCMNKFNKIYESWINYTSNIANSLEINYNVNDLFWQLDTFIFHNYFYNLKNNEKYIFEFVNVANLEKNEYTAQQLDILNMAFFKDRNEQYKLFYPHHKEYISTLIMNNRIFLVYFEKELYLISNTNNNNSNNNKNDFQFSDGKLHPALSLNNSVIGNTDLDIIKLEKGKDDDVLNFPTIRDKRQIIIKNTKPLYNTLVDLVTLNKLNSSLYKFNPLLFNLSLIIFHAMLHIKRDITANNNNYDPSFPHDNSFLKEYINYTPSALYGHPMIPPLTLSSY